MIAEIQQWVQSSVGLTVTAQSKLFYSILIVLGLFVLHRTVIWIVRRRTDDVRTRYHARKISAYVGFTLGILMAGQIWFTGLRDIGTFLGLFSAGLAIALRDIVTSIAGWAYCLLRRPFEVGDRIQIADQAGDVVDIRLFRFSLMEIGNWVEADQSTGRSLHIPNSRILTDVIANYTRGFEYIWNELRVLVTFESDWRKAKEFLEEIGDRHSTHLTEAAMKSVRKAARKQMILYSVLTPKVWTSVADCGVLLTIRYLCDPRERRSTEELMWEDILTKFGECEDIDFAYPTIRRYINTEEGKSGTGGPQAEKLGKVS